MTPLRSSDRPSLTANEFLSMTRRPSGRRRPTSRIAGRPLRRMTVDPGVGVRPANAPGDNVRVPDAVVMCRGPGKDSALVLIEMMALSNAGAEHKQKRADLKAVEEVREILELAQDGPAAQVFRRHDAGWLSFEVLGGDAVLRLESPRRRGRYGRLLRRSADCLIT